MNQGQHSGSPAINAGSNNNGTDAVGGISLHFELLDWLISAMTTDYNLLVALLSVRR
ncbi:MAG: hypothetical protein WBG70_16190 [Spirulinaceae cyanobacterium]